MKLLKELLSYYKFELIFCSTLLIVIVAALPQSVERFAEIIWPFTFLLYSFASVNLFFERKIKNHQLTLFLIFVTFVIPFLWTFYNPEKNKTFLWVAQVACIGYIILFGYTFIQLVRLLIKFKKIDFHTIFGALSGYIVLGILGAFIFMFIEINVSDSFRGLVFKVYSFPDFLYYSFITLTTIGYGDIVPLAVTARTIAALFGIFGQFYSLVLIGIIISKLSS